MPAVGSERAPRRSRFKVSLLAMSGTRSSAILVAWQVILTPLPFPTIWVLVGLTRSAFEEEKIALFLEHSWKQHHVKFQTKVWHLATWGLHLWTKKLSLRWYRWNLPLKVLLGTQWRKPWWRILGVIVKREANVRECIITIFEVITTTTQQPVDKAHRQYGATQPQVLAIFSLSSGLT